MSSVFADCPVRRAPSTATPKPTSLSLLSTCSLPDRGARRRRGPDRRGLGAHVLLRSPISALCPPRLSSASPSLLRAFPLPDGSRHGLRQQHTASDGDDPQMTETASPEPVVSSRARNWITFKAQGKNRKGEGEILQNSNWHQRTEILVD
jgi:hypothetical protein